MQRLLTRLISSLNIWHHELHLRVGNNVVAAGRPESHDVRIELPSSHTHTKTENQGFVYYEHVKHGIGSFDDKEINDLILSLALVDHHRFRGQLTRFLIQTASLQYS